MAEKPHRRAPVIRLAVSVEGQTEEEFVKQVLAGHLRERRVEPTPVLLGRARGRSGGGNVSSVRLVSEMVWLLRFFDAVTSLVDFYGFRGKGGRSVEDLEAYLRDEIAKRIGSSRNAGKVVPYVQRHEFEGLLFSNVEVFSKQVDFPSGCRDELQDVRKKFTTPEDINDHSQTAPSKRIAKVIPRYKKPLHGPLLAEKIGLDGIRVECPRFNAWVKRLESLAD